MEDLFGSSLVFGEPDSKPKPTSDVLKGADLVAIYFSASWCPPCKSFTPVLVDFYNACGSPKGLKIVYASSDRDVSTFRDHFKKMPWAAIPMNGEGSQAKQALAEKLQIQGIPALVVLDGKTGKYITDNARNEVTAAAGDKAKGAALINEWKGKEAVSIEEADFTHGKEAFGISTITSFFLRNPLYIFGMLYFFNRAMTYLQAMGEEKGEGTGKEL